MGYLNREGIMEKATSQTTGLWIYCIGWSAVFHIMGSDLKRTLPLFTIVVYH